MRHHAEVLDNLRRMKEEGVKAWIEAEEKRWLCPQCKDPVEWYARSCFHCGTEQQRRLPKLPTDKK
jgi:predicted amidophosphoribosyltransferase